jgi:E3 ubiquitin-protein ligase RAD18
LSDKGDASQMRHRHERWVNLWNAEIDAKKPRTKAELLNEMLDWEQARSRGKVAPKVDNSKEWLVCLSI